MAVTKEQLIEKLNNDLAWEYTAAIQYVQHSGVITGAVYTSIRKEIIVHANEELQHAITLADQISYLGGTPTVNVYDPKISDDNVKMLEQDLAGEEDAVKRYIERVSEAEELKLYHLSQQLRNILVMEQEHAKDLTEALGR
jgi:bacterioferritin